MYGVWLAGLLASWAWLQPQPALQAGRIAALGANGSRYEQVQFGMTEKQVETIMGGPRGIYDGQLHHEPPGMGLIIGADSEDGARLSFWCFADCGIEVSFDKAGKVDMKKLATEEYVTLDLATRPPTLTDRLDSALKWVRQPAAPRPLTPLAGRGGGGRMSGRGDGGAGVRRWRVFRMEAPPDFGNGYRGSRRVAHRHAGVVGRRMGDVPPRHGIHRPVGGALGARPGCGRCPRT